MKCAPLSALSEEDAVVRQDPDREADVAEAADEGVAVEQLELVEAQAVDDARDDLADVVADPVVLQDDAEQLVEVVQRLLGLFRLPGELWARRLRFATISRPSASACSSFCA